MSKNNDTVKRGRGRPQMETNMPETITWTINDIVALNPGRCRLSLVQANKRLLKAKLAKKTRDTVPTGGVGKPLTVYMEMAAFKRSEASRKAAKTRKMNAKLPAAAPVDLTPTPVTTPVTTPVAA